MINFRFHLISLVAVFLALGVGVAMGASFVDRATVDSLRSRVDDLDEGYRRRGAELDATREQLGLSDAQASALAGPGSEAMAGRLDGAPIVVLATSEVPRAVIDDVRTSLAASGADRAGTVRLQPPLTSPSGADLTAARARLGLKGDRAAVRTRIATDLGISLALLSAAPPVSQPIDPVTTTTAAPDASVVTTPTDAAGARAYLAALAELGMISVADTDEAGETRFPIGSGYRYVLIGGSDEDAGPIVEPLATAEADRAPRTLTVAEAGAPRAAGDATTTTVGQPEPGTFVATLRTSDAADALSTVDDLDESFGRIAVVYAIAEQRDIGRVGHYGTGQDATAPFPTVPGS